MNDPHTLSTHLLIGEVLKPQGIRGEVKVKPVTCDPERFYDLEQVFFEKNGQYEPVPGALRPGGQERRVPAA